MTGLLVAPVFAQSDEVGVLVLAHGGSPEWNRQVEAAVREAGLAYPTQIAFGMGMTVSEVRQIQQAVDLLERSGAKEILAIPLLISSHSSVYRQYQYLLGKREAPSWPDHPVRPVKARLQIRMGRALDDAEEVAHILLERARRLSQDPSKEALVLVGHGPEEEEDEMLWLKAMESLAARVKRQGGFAAFSVATLRDDAPPSVREKAIEHLRSQVAALAGSHPVLVIPLLMSQNGIEGKIAEALNGVPAVLGGETLLPHPGISRWIRRQADPSLSPAD